MMIFALAAGALAAGRLDADMHALPVDYETVGSTDIRIPISDSVRAATWDDLVIRPSGSVTVRVACIVFTMNGAPGGCIDAALVPQGQQTVDWARLRDDDMARDRVASEADVELHKIAEQRIDAARLMADRGAKSLFAIRFFEERVDPADARATFTPGEVLTLRDVTLTRPIDAALLQDLYPVAAMRFSVNARVEMICRIEPSLKLLCRDEGSISSDIAPGEKGDVMPDLRPAFRFSTYQLASTLQFEPKSKDGQDIVGRNLKLAIRWSLPDLK